MVGEWWIWGVEKDQEHVPKILDAPARPLQFGDMESPEVGVWVISFHEGDAAKDGVFESIKAIVGLIHNRPR